MRRKILHPQSWGRNVAKTNHLKGLEYRKARGVSGSATVPPRSVQTGNCSKCRYKCSSNFPEDVKEKILKDFCGLGDYARQKDFIVNNVVEIATKTESKKTQKRRKVSRAFFLKNQGIKMRVWELLLQDIRHQNSQHSKIF